LVIYLQKAYSKSSKIEISNITHHYDYIKMTNWIENLDNDSNGLLS